MLAKVKDRISNPSNTFILFNHWDRVEEDGEEEARRVKQQQLSKVSKIMVRDLKIFIDRGRQMPEGPALLKEHRYQRRDTAEQL